MEKGGKGIQEEGTDVAMDLDEDKDFFFKDQIGYSLTNDGFPFMRVM